MKTMLKKIHKNSERGQAIILIAFAIIGLVAIVGLMIDGGILLIEYAKLKRGIDAASIAAASQFRKPQAGAAGVAMGVAMENAGMEFLGFNQSTADVTVWTCSYPGTSHDALLCAPTGQPQRKLVRITASKRVDFGFMRVVGFDHTTISATALGEAASIDMVLMIDTSASMAYETTVGGNPNQSDSATATTPGDNPRYCNDNMTDVTKRCEPLGKIKDAAVNFVDQLFYPYDRVAVVTTTSQAAGGNRNSTEFPTGVSFMDNDNAGVANTEVQDTVRALRVFQPVLCSDGSAATSLGGCLNIDASGVYQGLECPSLRTSGNPTKCGSSNIGGGFYKSAEQFLYARQDSFWVVIALIGGPTNATNSVVGYPDGFCPGTPGNPTWVWPGPLTAGYCRYRDSTPYNPLTDRHYTTINNTDPANPVIVYPTNYDPDDYARDGADYLASSDVGATIFTICMGSYCRGYPSPDPLSGEHLGQYAALSAGDNPTAVPPYTANHGDYYFALTPADLAGSNGVFAKIADNIFTRIAR